MKPANIFAGGWTAQKAAKLNQTKLPDKYCTLAALLLDSGLLPVRTRCKACKKIKTINHYSNKQQAELRHRIAGPHGEKASSATAQIITCRACTGGQNHEMTCIICGEPKGLEAFSKAQRKDPDNARCLICVNEHINEPWAHVNKDGEHGEDESDTDSDTNTFTNAYASEVNTATSALREINLSEHDKAYSDATHKKKGADTATESDLLGTWSSVSKGKGKAKENEPIPYTSYDSQGGAHARHYAQSVTSSDHSVEIITDGPEQSRFAKPRVQWFPSTLLCTAKQHVLQRATGNTGWAKKPSGPPQKRPDNIIDQLKASATGRTVSYNDDEEDSDDLEWGTL
ncbi:MAG: hypothetical protein L6R40_004952 [Gallowayella cf. fulva]|nr:MAG: hypothetical protein L6R40_004952 [Xanthomendoza cf. fulva]